MLTNAVLLVAAFSIAFYVALFAFICLAPAHAVAALNRARLPDWGAGVLCALFVAVCLAL